MAERHDADASSWLAAHVPWAQGGGQGVALDEPAARLQPDAVVATMARITRQIHALDPTGCPRLDITTLLARARDRVEAGLVSAESFAEPYRRYGPERLLEIVEASVTPALDIVEDLVVTHGALTADAVRVEQGAVVSVASPSLPGVADRYRDLAVTCSSLAIVIGAGAVAPFLAEYGIDRPDPVKLDFFVLVSQFG